MGLYQLVERLEHAEALDAPAEALQERIGKSIRTGPFKDLLSGTWLGHPVHPLLVTVPIGSWVGAAVLDLGGAPMAKAADRMVGLGVLSALPTALAGASDWLDTVGAERRVGFVHASGNYAAVALMGLSWVARKRGRRGVGVTLSLLANGLVSVTGYLGGHMSYAQGVGVDTTAFDSGPQEWTDVGVRGADLREDEPVAVRADDITLLLVRRLGRVLALADRCTHRGGPLHEGQLDDGCIVCPWHASAFRLTDGAVVRGPAVQPQPVYETRELDGRVEVRRLEVKGLRSNST